MATVAKEIYAQIMVSFAGHASVHSDKFLLCPFDWKTHEDGISLEDIHKLVEDTRSCFIFLDCCSTGQFSLERNNTPRSVQILVPTTEKVRDGKLTTTFVQSLNVLNSILPGI
jgi:hypothetical protein